MANEPPLTTFDGYLKCHRPEFTNAIGAMAVAVGCPGFIDSPLPDPATLEFGDLKATPQYAVVETQFRRRYAGDLLNKRTLPRGRYYTVCSNERGEDGQTLANEMNAYRDPSRGAECYVVDRCDPRLAEDGYTYRAVDVFLRFRPNYINHGISDVAKATGFSESQLLAQPLQVRVPYVVERHVIPKVLDLRLPRAQNWLWETLGHGNEMLTILSPPKDKGSFFTMLPLLTHPRHGGCEVTNAIGNWLRCSLGVTALIFPAARSDVVCLVRNGALEQFRGWNLVDFRDAPPPFMENAIWQALNWDSDVLDPGIHAEIMGEGENAGAWRIVGAVEAHKKKFDRELAENCRLFQICPDFGNRSRPMTTAQLREIFKDGRLRSSMELDDFGSACPVPPYTVGEILNGPMPPDPFEKARPIS